MSFPTQRYSYKRSVYYAISNFLGGQIPENLAIYVNRENRSLTLYPASTGHPWVSVILVDGRPVTVEEMRPWTRIITENLEGYAVVLNWTPQQLASAWWPQLISASIAPVADERGGCLEEWLLGRWQALGFEPSEMMAKRMAQEIAIRQS